jgi:rhomboid family GlyGly-CTERM serine protease
VRIPWITIGLVIAAGGLSCSPAAARFLEYDRAAVGDGALWRLLGCQLTHWSFDHLLWDVAATLILGGACEILALKRFRICLAASFLLIPLAVWACLPWMGAYRGLSGTASALFGLLAVLVYPNFPAGALACLVALAAKTGLEWATGACLFADGGSAGYVPVPLAHAVGAGIGILAGCWPESVASVRPGVVR